MTDELKPCPFCGSENIEYGIREMYLCRDIYIKCKSCGGRIQICAEYGREELIKRWNRMA